MENFRLLLAVAFACGCGKAASTSSPDLTTPTTVTADAAVQGDTIFDPFSPLPDTSEGLTNLSNDLSALLENGALADACTHYFGGQTDRKTMLLCGKSMFFDQPFGTAGLPAPIAKYFAANFPDQLGLGFSKLGMIEDPRSADHLPLGLAPTTPTGSLANVAFTCASCHMTQLSDGRYSIGTPNHRWQYGKEILTVAVVPGIALGSSMASAHDPAAVALVQPILDAINANLLLKAQLVSTVISLASGASSGGASSAPAMSTENEHYYATWFPGTMDFIIQPLPYDDHVLTISKMLGIWDQPMDAEVQSSGMMNAMLAWTGDAHSLTAFINEFVVIGAGDVASWPVEKLQPLIEYVYSLRSPANPNPPPANQVAAGRKIFADSGCLSCHDGPRGSGKQLYDYSEIGTDSQMQYWLDSTGTATPCCGFTLIDGVSLNHQVKSPRLTGLWTLQRFLHNGSVASLEDLLCENGPRGDVTALAYGNGGHSFGCNLSSDDKASLIAYLRAH